MSVKLKVWNIGIEGMEYVSVFNLKKPSGMHVILKNVLVITYLLWQLFFMLYLLLFLMCLNYVAELVWAKKKFLLILMIATDNKVFCIWIGYYGF